MNGALIIFRPAAASSFFRLSTTRNLSSETTGLYGIPFLKTAKGFRRFVDEAIQRSEELVSHVSRLPPSQEIIRAIDEIYNTVFSVMGPAELCRNTHPDREYVEEATNAAMRMHDHLHYLCTSHSLYSAVIKAEGEGFLQTEEARRAAHTLRVDSENGGVHLSAENMNRRNQLNTKIAQLGRAFNENIMIDPGSIDVYPASCIPKHVQHQFQAIFRPIPSALEEITISSDTKRKREKGLRIVTDSSTLSSILSWTSDTKVRKQAYIMGNSVPFANLAVLDNLISACQEVAQIMGCRSYAEFEIRPNMAASPGVVTSFLDDLSEIIRSKADEEYNSVRDFKRKMCNERCANLELWDGEYFTGMMMSSAYDLDPSVIATNTVDADATPQQLGSLPGPIKMYSKKKRKQPVSPGPAAVEWTDDLDTLPLSQLLKLSKQKHAPVTPQKEEAVNLIKPVAPVDKGKQLAVPAEIVQTQPAQRRLVLSGSPQPQVGASSHENILCPESYSHYEALMGTTIDLNIRVVGWWQGQLYGPNSLDSIIFLAVDESRYMLQGFVPPHFAKKWDIPVREGFVYHVSGVQIVPPNKKTQLVDAPVQLQATQKTFFEPLLDHPDHPNRLYKFFKFVGLPELPTSHPAHKDILAVVVDVRPTVAKVTRSRDRLTEFAQAFLTDTSIYPRCISFTIWQETVEKFPVFSHDFVAPFILQATGLKAYIYKMHYGFQSTFFTQLEFTAFHKRKARHLLKSLIRKENRRTDYPPFEAPHSQPLLQKEDTICTIAHFLSEAPKAVAGKELRFYTVVASLVHIFNEMPLTYRGCILCSKGMRDARFDYQGCRGKNCNNDDGKTTYWYKLTATIQDDSGTVDMTVFNTQATDLLRVPADTLRSLYSEADGIARIVDLCESIYGRVSKFVFRIPPEGAFPDADGAYTLYHVEWMPKGLSDVTPLLATLTDPSEVVPGPPC